jgi:tetratricopeptide (TPR) repeat protein
MVCHAALPCLAFALLWTPATAAEPVKVRWADDFATNTLKDYRTSGTVSWQKGRVLLKEGSSLVRPVKIGAVAEGRAVVHFPEGKEDLELLFVFQGHNQRAPFLLRRSAGKMALVNRGKPEETVPLAEPGATRQWIVRAEWQSGLLRVKAWPGVAREPKGWQTVRVAHEDFTDLESLAIEAEKGSGASVTRLEITGEAVRQKPDEAKWQKVEQGYARWGEAKELYGQGKFADAAARCQEAVDLATEGLGADWCFTILFRRDLVVMRRNIGELRTARALAESVLADATKVFGADHPQTGTAHNNLALLLYSLNEDNGAREHWLAALAVHERARGSEHADVALALDNLGALTARQGKYTEARKCHERALPSCAAVRQPRRPWRRWPGCDCST